MLNKRTFSKDFCREQEGEKFYTISDQSNNEVFVGRIFKDKDADAILILVEQAYNAGLQDMSSHITKEMRSLKF